jgi:predicted RNase H-like HicB family nuclease
MSSSYVTRAKLKFSYGYFIMGKANRGAPMNNQYTAVIKKDGNWWIGWIEEVPGVNCQEKSRKELMESLKVTLREALGFNKKEAIRAAGKNFQEEKITI